MKELILWGLGKGQPKYMEEVLAECISDDELLSAINKAKENGYENLRVMVYGGEAPDFSKILAL